MTPSRIGLLYGAGAFVFFAAVMNTVMPGWVAWYQLTTHGEHTDARVTRFDLPNHATCYFEYTIGSRRYEGSDQGCHSRVGDVVAITYVPTQPTFVTIASPKEQLFSQMFGAIALSTFAGISAAFQARRRLRRRATR
jgi:hypothetical protein